jgi:hypothetical protein
MPSIRILVAVVALVVASSASVDAKQYVRKVHGREVVVHTNPVPVVLHRLVPPQHGRHVTEREIRAGKIPAAGRSGIRAAQ